MASLNLPDEIILKILGELLTEPDILLNIAPLVCKHFRRLSYDSSLWRTFSVPGHWSYDTALRFLQLHPAGTYVQDLTCSTRFVTYLAELALNCDSLCIPNVVRLLVSSVDQCNFFSTQNCLTHFPALFPNLIFLRTSETMPHTYEQLHRLTTSLPNLKLELGAISSSAVLLMPAVCKEYLRLTRSEALEGFTQNPELFDLSNITVHLDISRKNEFDNFSQIDLKLHAVGHCVSEFELDCFVWFNDLQIITKVCRSLRKLHLHRLSGCEELWDIQDMTCLRDLYLRIAGCGFGGVEVTDEDTMKVINSCPSLETLAVGIPNTGSESTVCSLPLSLRSLEFLHPIGSGDVRNFVASILRGVQNNGIRLKSITGCDRVATVISEMIGKSEESVFLDDLEILHLTSVGVPRLVLQNILNILQHFNDRKISMKTLHVNEVSLSQNIFHVIAFFSDIHVLSLEGHFDVLVFPNDLDTLAKNLSCLERLKVKQNLELDEKLNLETIVHHLDPLINALIQFKRLTYFSLDGLMFDCSWQKTLDLMKAERKKAEQRLNICYGPWRKFTMGRNSVRFTQCPPAYRSFQEHEGCSLT